MRYLWFIEDEILVRRPEGNHPLERYEPKTGEWIPDWELDEIYTGEVRFKTLTEEEALEKMNVLNATR